MNHNSFKFYYTAPTKLVKTVFMTLEQILYHPTCLPHFSTHAAYTIPLEYFYHNMSLKTILYIQYYIHLLYAHSFPYIHPIPPRYFTQNLIWYFINHILNHKKHKILDSNKIANKYISYFCQWTLPHQRTYHKWLPLHKLFPWKDLNPISPNLLPFIQYYKRKQHINFSILINVHFTWEQPKDSKYILHPIFLPLICISTNEYNPKNGMGTNTSTIQLQHDCAHIYKQHDKHLITIPINKLQWLWLQYNNTINKNITLNLPPHSFETKIIWLYQRYKYHTSKNDPSSNNQYIVPLPIVTYLITNFNITHFYFHHL